MQTLDEIVATTSDGAPAAPVWVAILTEWASLYGAADPEPIARAVWADFVTVAVSPKTMIAMILQVREAARA